MGFFVFAVNLLFFVYNQSCQTNKPNWKHKMCTKKLEAAQLWWNLHTVTQSHAGPLLLDLPPHGGGVGPPLHVPHGRGRRPPRPLSRLFPLSCHRPAQAPHWRCSQAGQQGVGGENWFRGAGGKASGRAHLKTVRADGCEGRLCGPLPSTSGLGRRPISPAAYCHQARIISIIFLP